MVGSQPVLEESGHFGTGPGVCNHPARFSLENIGLFEFARSDQAIRTIADRVEQSISQHGGVLDRFTHNRFAPLAARMEAFEARITQLEKNQAV
jgi:hypothetical protein